MNGQTTVEFALICLPFFAILFAVIDYAQIYFYDNALQNAMREACRFGTAGRVIQQTYPNGSPIYETNSGGVVVPKAITGPYGEASRNESIQWWFLSNCVIQLPISNITIYSASVLPGQPPSVVTNDGVLTLVGGFSVTTNSTTLTVTTNAVPATKGPGAANDYIQVTATYNISTITPLFTYLNGYKGGWSRGSTSAYPLRVSAIVKNEPAYLNFTHTNIYPGE